MISRGMQWTGFALLATSFVVGMVGLLHPSTAAQPRTRWLLLGVLLNCLGGMILFAGRLWPAIAPWEDTLALGQIGLSVAGLGCVIRSFLVPVRVE